MRLKPTRFSLRRAEIVTKVLINLAILAGLIESIYRGR